MPDAAMFALLAGRSVAAEPCSKASAFPQHASSWRRSREIPLRTLFAKQLVVPKEGERWLLATSPLIEII
jgi:hypothetical protein